MRFYAILYKTHSILYFIICQKHGPCLRCPRRPAAVKKSRSPANFPWILTRYCKDPLAFFTVPDPDWTNQKAKTFKCFTRTANRDPASNIDRLPEQWTTPNGTRTADGGRRTGDGVDRSSARGSRPVRLGQRPRDEGRQDLKRNKKPASRETGGHLGDIIPRLFKTIGAFGAFVFWNILCIIIAEHWFTATGFSIVIC